MKRSILTIAVPAAALAAIGVATVIVVHAAESGRESAAPHVGSSLNSAAEDTFLAVTAAHLCNVGKTVYDDPKSLANAYESAPVYPGLTGAQVAELTARLRTDQSLELRLAQQIRATCH
jgi:hypothetical protein